MAAILLTPPLDGKAGHWITLQITEDRRMLLVHLDSQRSPRMVGRIFRE